ncbi:MAG TPA: DNA polymerase III subunit delta' [Stellaceae bacterium]|jgi:DNA polymerase-3 subunit delta'|nr:DNA polymerase III subunit delta' [Stellaceae bacterium]
MAEDEDDATEETTSAEAPELPHPRENTLLLGHEAAEASLLQSFNVGRLPHAWLITGPRGIGKATLAYRFARFLFAEGAGGGGGLFAAPATSLAVQPSHQAFRLVASGSHPDLLVVERGIDPKRKRQRREIVADDARAVGDFLHLTSSQGGWRVVIVDGADLMNPHAANSLLKILEEPPKCTVLLLASDNPGRLLPTIRSRCRTLLLKPLADAPMTALLQRYRPDLAAEDRAVLARLGEGSIGHALELGAGDGVAIYNFIINRLQELPKLDPELLHDFAEGLARSGTEDRFALLTELLPAELARLVASAAQSSVVPAAEDRARRNLVGRRSLDQWAAVWEKLTHLFARADGINLDRKQVVLNAFFVLEQAAR